MHFEPLSVYHVFNCGNNQQQICLLKRNYHYLKRKLLNTFSQHSEILAYCILPDRFHILIKVKDQLELQRFRNSIGICLRSYAQAINKQELRTGSLFQQHTQARKLITGSSSAGANNFRNCFNYIHWSPVRAKLVTKMEDWEYSSFYEYLGFADVNWCNIKLGLKLLGFRGLPELYAFAYGSNNHISTMSIDLRARI